MRLKIKHDGQDHSWDLLFKKNNNNLTPFFSPSGEHDWKTISSGIADCYFNATDLPVGNTVKFRVACANKAGQGPYSNPSGKVFIESAGEKEESLVLNYVSLHYFFREIKFPEPFTSIHNKIVLMLQFTVKSRGLQTWQL